MGDTEVRRELYEFRTEVAKNFDYISDEWGKRKGEENVDVPPLNERLRTLNPSRELLEYYREKIAEYDREHEDLVTKIEGYHKVCGDSYQIQWELKQREEEISELQKALSDMQIYLFQERDHVLRLYAENDRLKIASLEDKKKIQHLLSLSESNDGEITYFFKDPKVIVPRKSMAVKSLQSDGEMSLKFHTDVAASEKNKENLEKYKLINAKDNDMGKKKQLVKVANGIKGKAKTTALENELNKKDVESLQLQIKALQAQLEDQSRQSREHVESLMEDRNVHIEEEKISRDRDTEKIKSLATKLKHAQELLFESTKNYLELKYEQRAQEHKWMAERDLLVQHSDRLQDQVNQTRSQHNKNVMKNRAVETGVGAALEVQVADIKKHHSENVDMLESQLDQAQKMADMYREQCISLEDDLCRIREETEINRDTYKEKSEKISRKLRVMTQRYDSLEKRRNLEVEGFKNDVKHLRQKLKDVEKQLYKVTLNFGNYKEEKDLAILANVKQTAVRSKRMMDQLYSLKTKVYGMESDVRHL